MSTPPTDWIRSALEITGHFEDSADPWGGVVGDFDNMGVSLGVLQWNFGMGSLQPMVLRVGKAAVDASMPTIGEQFWAACNAAQNMWRPIVATWQTNGALHAVPEKELKAYARSAAFIAEQVSVSNRTAGIALTQAQDWADADPHFDSVTKALFCWFFDLTTQNGGLKGVTIADVEAYRASSADPRDLLCSWLEQRPNTISGGADARVNGKTWRAPVSPQRETLLYLSYLRSLKSVAKWQVDTLNRKGTIAMWKGKVHGDAHDLTALLS
jgi:hypothetical protein